MLSDIDFMQGLQERRLDTAPEPVYNTDIDITKPNILQERPFRNRRSPVIVEFADARDITSVVMSMMMEVGMNIMKMRMSFNAHNDRVKLMQKCAKAIQMCCEKFRVTNFPIATCGSVLTSMIKSGIMDDVSYYVKVYFFDKI
ncbi:uncharacterized protein LOC113231838 [Hyposmocoma kahamanoa]|uniref:uncharacterized protein LOC113231838 n=1 Tax=Hyposmocoma kahamanoa TaxID=1477025 RepID=UPI000E6D9D6C|nr:uncharacterized protein LOC113231838 [Hyposmocoma kahamanoa]